MKFSIALILLCTISCMTLSQAQTSTDANIIGDVQSKGEHVPYINISLKGTTIGTVTDNTGHFQLINIPEGGYTIVASGVGYMSQEYKITGVRHETSEIKFDLKEDVLNLMEVVVSADRNTTSKLAAPVIVNTIGSPMFETVQAICVADALDFTPGLRMECNCSNCGFSQLRMNGMDGTEGMILKDTGSFVHLMLYLLFPVWATFLDAGSI